MTDLPDNAFYRRQIACLEAGDLDALMEQYHDDAVLMTPETTVRGRAALRDYMTGYLARLGSLRLVSTEKFNATEGAILFEATAETAHGVARVYDAFVLRDGKASHHFAGVLFFAPHDPTSTT